MSRLAYFMLFAVGYMSLCIADDACCDNDNNEGAQPQPRAHVKLFYSGQLPQENVEDPREDYEWPGMNEDSFYDYFTK